jgi:uncharacterized RDD family membrane protein YckC
LRLEPGRSASARPDQARKRRPRQKGRYEGAAPAERLHDDTPDFWREGLIPGPAAGADLADRDDGGIPFQFDNDLFHENLSDDKALPGAAAPAGGGADPPNFGPEATVDQSGPAFALNDEEPSAGAGEPALERGEETPEFHQVPEVAGLGRRAAALLVDQGILGAILGLFFLGAFLALKISGFDTDLFLSSTGLRASLVPFALLAALLSLVYHVFFHGSTGRTPGKALAGVEVKTGGGAVPSAARAVLRWFCAALGLACAGLGLAWALFDPGRRGWADRLSGTVIARQLRKPSGGAPPR